MELAGKTIVVTGASRGIGKQVAIELGRRRAKVVCAARTVQPHRRLAGTIAETVDAVRAAGGEALAVPVDVRDSAGIERLAHVAVEEFGGVDALVNNAADTAGGSRVGPFMQLGRSDWLSQFDTNLHAPFSLMQAVVPSMADRGGGVIVNMTSGAADLVDPDGPARTVIGDRTYAYAASKAALNRLGNAVAPELRDLGIAVVAIDPGFTRTELVDLMVERANVDASVAVPMDVPTRAVVGILAADDAMRHSGTILRAARFVSDNGL